MRDYKFLRMVVMICATLVNTHTHTPSYTHTHTHTNKQTKKQTNWQLLTSYNLSKMSYKKPSYCGDSALQRLLRHYSRSWLT